VTPTKDTAVDEVPAALMNEAVKVVGVGEKPEPVMTMACPPLRPVERLVLTVGAVYVNVAPGLLPMLP
jgi:hypothetical protein